MKTWYAWATPSGPIRLIEGDKMPVKPEMPGNLCRVTCGQWLCQCHLYADQCQEYEAALQAAKEQAVPIGNKQDYQLRQMILMLPSVNEIANDTIYGPFSLRYEIQNTAIVSQNIAGMNVDVKQIAILYDDTAEKERPDYINKEFKKVSESDLKAALREVNLKNKEIRDSYNDPDRLNFMVGGDWTEDFTHENGNYLNKCGDCGLSFKGHKRRVRCKKCSSSPEKEPQEDQETLWREVDRIFNVKWTLGIIPYEVMQELKEKFTITRK